jgi:hypothetical protein
MSRSLKKKKKKTQYNTQYNIVDKIFEKISLLIINVAYIEVCCLQLAAFAEDFVSNRLRPKVRRHKTNLHR